MSAPDEAEQLAFASYWDARYKTTVPDDKPTHEWFRGYESLKPWFQEHLFSPRPPNSSVQVVHLGCGDSTIPHDLYQAGYKSQLCVDFSDIVIKQMSERYAADSGVSWQCADVRDLPLDSGSIDVAFDKGTLDAMIFGSPWSPPEVVKENTSRYIDEVSRVLKADGIFLYVTFRQPHFVRPLLNSKDQWDMHMDTLSDGEGSFDYFGFVLRKKSS